MRSTGILLESGTNELEIVEFQVAQTNEKGESTTGYYGVNVAKVKEIIRGADEMVDVPKAHPAISGVINLRGKIIPIIDLPHWLNKDNPNLSNSRIIITEFNNVVTGFLVQAVTRIHRVSWEAVEPPSGLMNNAERECVTGLVKFDDRILMMLDFERIVAEINPETGLKVKSFRSNRKRKGKTVMIAEDSAFTRKLMVDMLKSAGYRVFSARNGLDAFNRLLNVAKEAKKKNVPLERYINIIVSDVEMPQMDGLHFTAQIMNHDELKKIPVVLFSSVVTAENKKKWRSLGAVDYLAKPDIDKLVQVMDAKAL